MQLSSMSLFHATHETEIETMKVIIVAGKCLDNIIILNFLFSKKILRSIYE
jgi:hypothetical protein